MKHRCPCCNHEFSDPKPPAGLTAVQAKVLRVIEGLIAKKGFSPSYNEIGAAAGMSSRSSINRVVCALHERGFLTFQPGRARSISLIQQRTAA